MQDLQDLQDLQNKKIEELKEKLQELHSRTRNRGLACVSCRSTWRSSQPSSKL